ncbi:MAG: chain length-determining protein [Betaproteobacteria bacterium]|nr:chain length-determining protein [Betaproteobacteria bacterium]
MDDLIRQALVALRGMWQRRWIGLAAAWIVAIGGTIAVLRIPDKYEASARIYVDTQSVLKPLMSGIAIQPNIDQQVMILSRTLISRPNVEKLVRMADLDLGANSKREQEALIDELMKTLTIQTTGRDNLYTLAYRATQPDKAKRVVQSLVSIFVESSLGGKRKDSDAAKKFIDEQIKNYEKKLEEAEARLKDFKLRNITLASGEGKDYYGRVGEISAQLNQARLELREAENSRDALKRQILGEEPVLLPESAPEPAAGVSLPEIDGRIEALKRNLDTILLRYTDQHPDVLGARRVIADLEEQKRQQLAARAKVAKANPTAAGSINSNPVYQQLKVSLAESEATVASLRTRVAEYESRYARLRESAKLVPQIEAEFTQLNRDYDINKKNYEALVARRESAEIGGEMEASGGGADFRLIDPPRVSPQPVAPNRLVLLPLALLAALGAGLFASFAASQVWPTFADSRSLRDATGVPVLGTVSMIVSDARKRKERRGLVGFLAGAVALLGSFGAGLLALFLLSLRTV